MKLDDAIAQLQRVKATLVDMAPNKDAQNPDVIIDFGYTHDHKVFLRHVDRITLNGTGTVQGRFHLVFKPGQQV